MTDFYRAKEQRGATFVALEGTVVTPSFGDGSVDPSAMRYLKTQTVEMPVGFEYQETNDIVQEDEEDIGVFLHQPGDGKITMGLHPARSEETPVAAPPAVDNSLANLPPMMIPLHCGFGKIIAGQAPATISSGDGETFSVASATNIRPGEGYAVVRDDAVIWFSAVKTVDGSNVTLRHPMESYSWASGDKLVGGYTMPLVPAPSTVPTMSVVHVGESADMVYSGQGVAISNVKMSAPYRGLATMEFDLAVALPDPPDTDDTDGAPDPQDYDYPDSQQVLNGGLWIYADGNIKLSGGAEFNLEQTCQPVSGVHSSDPNGIQGYVQTSRRVRVVLTPVYEDASWYAALREELTFTLTMWFGNCPRVWGFQVPAAFLAEPTSDGDTDGVATYQLTVGASKYTGDTGTFTRTEAGNKPALLWVMA